MFSSEIKRYPWLSYSFQYIGRYLEILLCGFVKTPRDGRLVELFLNAHPCKGPSPISVKFHFNSPWAIRRSNTVLMIFQIFKWLKPKNDDKTCPKLNFIFLFLIQLPQNLQCSFVYVVFRKHNIKYTIFQHISPSLIIQKWFFQKCQLTWKRPSIH